MKLRLFSICNKNARKKLDTMWKEKLYRNLCSDYYLTTVFPKPENACEPSISNGCRKFDILRQNGYETHKVLIRLHFLRSGHKTPTLKVASSNLVGRTKKEPSVKPGGSFSVYCLFLVLAYPASVLQRKVTICARVQGALGLNLPSPVPPVTPLAAAHETAGA